MSRDLHTLIQRRIPGNCLIIGAGILGLWAARQAILRGWKVTVIEKRQVGSGASGGFLGALMPHMPDSWNAKKQMQFDGLSSIGEAVAALEADTGMDCGFRRCGRLMPLTHEAMRAHADARIAGARENWQGRFEMVLHEHQCDDWLSSQSALYGATYDNLSARINPRKTLAALKAFAKVRATLIEGEEVVALEPRANRVVLQSGAKISADHIIVANGWEAYALLQPFMGAMNKDKPIGCGVKGQAVLVEFAHDDRLPIVYHDGTYVVPHAQNRVAIGSSSVKDWQAGKNAVPDGFDPDDTGFYERALQLVPALRDAPIVERWAGVRPRNTFAGRGTEPFFGPVPGHDNLSALIGGFKITFGVAHRTLECLHSRGN